MEVGPCFCGCGEQRVKYDPLNIELFMVYLELGRWLNWVAIQEAAGGEESENTEQFLWDGRTLYIRLVDEIHSGTKRPRKERKQTKKWVEFSRESREKVADHVVNQGMPDPFDIELPSPQEVRAWVDEGTLPSVNGD